MLDIVVDESLVLKLGHRFFIKVDEDLAGDELPVILRFHACDHECDNGGAVRANNLCVSLTFLAPRFLLAPRSRLTDPRTTLPKAPRPIKSPFLDVSYLTDSVSSVIASNLRVASSFFLRKERRVSTFCLVAADTLSSLPLTLISSCLCDWIVNPRYAKMVRRETDASTTVAANSELPGENGGTSRVGAVRPLSVECVCV